MHGAYSLLRHVAAGTLDQRTRHAAAIRIVCEQLARDLGAEWEELSVQQRLLIEQVAVKATVLGTVAVHALDRGIVDADGRLISPLNEHYLAFANSLRLDLLALGLERREKHVIDVAAALADLPEGNGRRKRKTNTERHLRDAT